MRKNQTKKTSQKKSHKKNSNVLFGIACVILGLLIILIFFLVKKDQIFTNLKETEFFDRVFGATPQIIENHDSKKIEEQETIPLKSDQVIIEIQNTEKTDNLEEKATTQEQTEQKNLNKEISSSEILVEKQEIQSSVISSEKVDENQKSGKTEKNPQSQEKKNTANQKDEKNNQTAEKTTISLCFVQIDGDGLVSRKVVKRNVQKNESPLTNALNLLLQGPDFISSSEKNCITVIPKGTKLLSAKVQNGIAYLNFNDSLEFNEFGVEGIIHSLEQIVFTATSFSTVKSVQFLIDGQKRDYIGSEGQWIGTPLSRENF